ncbi:hypothetical protein [Rhizobium fabae]|uniref:Uncharacterized protein n=1 Tax=Rhizobium fabae TaxID=573179 RepID=A0A7W6BGQ2_9HYPH|nr:hypothetical protein [Rhizobium fabae]MBB3918719.1 hypothetical protein [Rhizobium fabae]
MTDIHMIMSTIGIAELNFCYSGATLAGTLHFLGETDALAIILLCSCGTPPGDRHEPQLRNSSTHQADRYSEAIPKPLLSGMRKSHLISPIFV